MRRTLADMKNPAVCRIAEALNLDPTDARYTAILNEAQERLLPTGEWWGTLALYRCAAEDSQFVWPPGIAGVRGVAICSYPLRNRDMFFEFSQLALGIDGPTLQHIDQGNMPVQRQITGITSVLKLYCDLTDDITLPIRAMGLDENGNWIRSEEPPESGNWVDGELIYPSGVGTLSTHIYSTITGVQKPRSSGAYRLYGYDTVGLTQTILAIYQYHETNPWYRVTKVPGLFECVPPTGQTVTVDVLFKYDFTPVVVDTDYMLIGCVPALKDMCQAIKAAESASLPNDKAGIIAQGITLARTSLEAELRHYRGNPEVVVNVDGSGGPLNISIPNFV